MRLDTKLNINGTSTVATTDKETLTRFREARHRSKKRMGRQDLQNHEFLQLLLDVWEEHEEPRRVP